MGGGDSRRPRNRPRPKTFGPLPKTLGPPSQKPRSPSQESCFWKGGHLQATAAPSPETRPPRKKSRKERPYPIDPTRSILIDGRAAGSIAAAPIVGRGRGAAPLLSGPSRAPCAPLARSGEGKFEGGSLPSQIQAEGGGNKGNPPPSPSLYGGGAFGGGSSPGGGRREIWGVLVAEDGGSGLAAGLPPPTTRGGGSLAGGGHPLVEKGGLPPSLPQSLKGCKGGARTGALPPGPSPTPAFKGIAPSSAALSYPGGTFGVGGTGKERRRCGSAESVTFKRPPLPGPPPAAAHAPTVIGAGGEKDGGGVAPRRGEMGRRRCF